MITSRAYHALFMHNMLIRPTEEELAHFGEPDYTIYNAGEPPAGWHHGMSDVKDLQKHMPTYIITSG